MVSSGFGAGGLLQTVMWYAVFGGLWGLCYGFVLLGSVAGGGEAHVFPPAGGWHYHLTTTVLMAEKNNNVAEKQVGFRIGAEVRIESKWVGGDEERLLKITVDKPVLKIRSTNNPSNDFEEHTSLLESLPNNPYYVLYKNGNVEKVLLPKDESVALANFKKGIAGLLQFQQQTTKVKENDSSGECHVSYTVLEPGKIQKVKETCESPDLQLVKNPNQFLDVRTTSQRHTIYELSQNYIESIKSEETHDMWLAASNQFGNSVRVLQELTFVKESNSKKLLFGNNFGEVYDKLYKNEGPFTEETLRIEMEYTVQTKSFTETVNAYRSLLKSDVLGTIGSGKGFLKVIDVTRRASRDDILKALNSKKNQMILHQLFDILGYAQTSNSHEASMKKLHLDDQNQEELCERYLWALAVSSQPNPEIVIDLLSKYKNTQNIPEKVKETLISTIASMAYHLSKLNKPDVKVHQEVERIMTNYLDVAKGDERIVLLRALQNLKSPRTIPVLLKITEGDSLKEAVLAWKALRALPVSELTNDVRTAARRTFYQAAKKEDSSSRTLALDIILDTKPCDSCLRGILKHLLTNDKMYEVKQYTVQRLRMKAEKDPNFRAQLSRLINEEEKLLSNYHVWGQRGLSVALSRQFLDSSSINGSLLTVQEMSHSIVKRGTVSVVIEQDGVGQDTFSLGAFSGGLGGFFSSESDGEDEAMTAGMQLGIMDYQIRPFTFFHGQGELMGHVWSGTASEKTTAFQALVMLQDHRQYIRLGPGFIAELDVKGVGSFDLSGQVQFSLWNRNAESLIEKSTGIVVQGLLKIDTAFVRSLTEFSLTMEPQLNIRTDIDFSSGIYLCMRVMQPSVIVKHNIYKIERIPGSKHKIRKAKYMQYHVPGKTYALNKKNTDMCNMIFGQL